MDLKRLMLRQRLPLEVKIMMFRQRIINAVDKYGVDGLYISFSGGKDSIVLRHLVGNVLEELGYARDVIPTVFCDTELEWDSVRKFGYTADVVIKPDMKHPEVIKKYGYPAPSKEQAQYIRQYRTCKSEKTKKTRIEGNKWGRGKISNKNYPLIFAEYMVSEQCCDVMKKKPFKKYEKKTGRIPIIGVMAEESQLRKTNYLKTGCSAFELERPYLMPLGFFVEQDILNIIINDELDIPEIYGDIVEIDFFGKLGLTGETRTGCVFCMFGGARDNYAKFDTLKKKDPKKYDYCMRGGSMQWDERLGMNLWKPDKGLGMARIIKDLKNINRKKGA